MDRKYFTLVMSCLVAVVSSQQDGYDYCDPKLKLCEVATDHIMCKYPVPGLSSQCTPGVHEPLNSTEKDRILFLHNKFRSYVAEGTEKNKIRKLPPSSNMRQLYWDNELENIAARWAEQCVKTTSRMVYDKCRNTKRFQVSQNVGTRRVNGSSIDKQAPQIVITWYKESKDFDPALVEKFTPNEDVKMSVRQFANIIWAETNALGCARIIFQEHLPVSDKDTRTFLSTTERLVCNYGPGGGVIGKQIYKRGAPCDNCPNGTKCSNIYSGLCATQSAEKPKEQHKIVKGETKGATITKEEKTSTTGPSEGECEGEDCNTSDSAQPELNEIMKFPRPTARKKSLDVVSVMPAHEDDIVIEKRKWTVSNRKKVRRHDLQQETLKDGDSCKCYFASEDSGSSRMKLNIFLLLFSAFVTAECFLFHTAKQ